MAASGGSASRVSAEASTDGIANAGSGRVDKWQAGNDVIFQNVNDSQNRSNGEASA